MLSSVLVILFITTSFTESRTNINDVDHLLQRVKRWREFDCPPQCYLPPHHHHFYPPHYWQHGPPPPRSDYYQYQNSPDRDVRPEPEPEPEPTNTGTQRAEMKENRNEKVTLENKEMTAGNAQKDREGKTAISNAESETGDAIAVSISGKNN